MGRFSVSAFEISSPPIEPPEIVGVAGRRLSSREAAAKGKPVHCAYVSSSSIIPSSSSSPKGGSGISSFSQAITKARITVDNVRPWLLALRCDL